jgi:hypothetical protein
VYVWEIVSTKRDKLINFSFRNNQINRTIINKTKNQKN